MTYTFVNLYIYTVIKMSKTGQERIMNWLSLAKNLTFS